MTTRTSSPVTPGIYTRRLAAKVDLELRARKLHELVLGLHWVDGWPPEAIAEIRKAAVEVAALTDEEQYR